MIKVLFISCGLALISCFSESYIEPSGELSYLALGDSYTICEGMTEVDRWPNQLAVELSAYGIKINKPQIIARTGWRTDDLMKAVKGELDSQGYDMVSLLIGANNLFQGKSIEQYKKDVSELLSICTKSCKRGNKGVFVLSIPDYGSTPFAKQRNINASDDIDLWNEAMKTICNAEGVAFYNITPSTKSMADDEKLIAPDGLHPSAEMYKKWVDDISNAIVESIKS